jgi:hypothetical protein
MRVCGWGPMGCEPWMSAVGLHAVRLAGAPWSLAVGPIGDGSAADDGGGWEGGRVAIHPAPGALPRQKMPREQGHVIRRHVKQMRHQGHVIRATSSGAKSQRHVIRGWGPVG